MAATASTGRRGSRAPIVGINVTPMVDVVLVLLVIMMVSATYIVSQTLRVNLPTASSSDGSTASPSIVTIAADRSMRFGEEPVTEAQLIERLRGAVAAAPRPEDVTLIISADTDAPHGAVVHVMDLARAEHIGSFAINVERTASE